jgi:predicted DNA-binding transcriptional regulator YafY
MDRTERFYKIDQLLGNRKAVPRDMFIEELGVSPATFKRDLEYMRERLHAPIVWDSERRGYRYADPEPNAPAFSLPGLWFNASEIHALLTMQQLLDNIQPGLLEPHIGPLLARIQELLEDGDYSAGEIRRRIRILGMAARPVMPRQFEIISSALLSRKRLEITHYHRGRDETSERQVSPQRLVHYRDNWYLDTWCHERDALRTFSVDGIRNAVLLDRKARNVADRHLDAELGSGYGIFAGARTRTAKLRFSVSRSRWVADEQWHPKQRAYRDAEGQYVLEIPFSDERELLMDILKHGPEVEVLSPATLREKVAVLHEEAARRYESGPAATKRLARGGRRRGARPAHRLTS